MNLAEWLVRSAQLDPDAPALFSGHEQVATLDRVGVHRGPVGAARPPADVFQHGPPTTRHGPGIEQPLVDVTPPSGHWHRHLLHLMAPCANLTLVRYLTYVR